MIKVLSKEMSDTYINKYRNNVKNKDEFYYKASLAIYNYSKINNKTLVIIGDSNESVFSLSFALLLKSRGVDVSILQVSPINNSNVIDYLSKWLSRGPVWAWNSFCPKPVPVIYIKVPSLWTGVP